MSWVPDWGAALADLDGTADLPPGSRALADDAIRGSLYEAKWRGPFAKGDQPDIAAALRRARARLSDPALARGAPPAPADIPPLGVGWGTYGWKGDATLARFAAARGASLIDTAPTYGRGRTAVEPRLGEALAGLHLDPTWIATKFARHHSRPAAVLASIERSRRALRRDRLDLVQVHWPNPDVPLEATLGALVEAQARGWIRAIGVCNFSVDLLHRARLCAPVVSVQVRLNNEDALALGALRGYCSRNGVRMIAHSPFAQRGATQDLARLVELGFSPIPGTNDIGHLSSNLAWRI